MVLEGLVKTFGGSVAVDHLSLRVPAGSMFGLVGPNGAGKTTTLSMTTGLLRPDHGTATVLGHDVWSDPAAAKAVMGIAPDGMRLFDTLSGGELLRFVGELRSMPRALVRERSAELLQVLGLAESENVVVADYSAGMTKKIGLACALLHAPRLLVLDEPFESVDPVSADTILAILRRFVAGGGTVIMSSHVMEFVEVVCDRVAVVAGGRVLAAGTTAQVQGGMPLRQRFLSLVGATGMPADGGLQWLQS